MVQDWIECTLADTCSSIDYGYTASAVDSAVGPKFLRITDIVSGHIDWGAVPYVSADEKTLEKYQLHNGDIVIARTGASTGASSYVHQPPVAVFASYLVRLKIKPEFDSRYLAYYLKSDAFWSYIRGVLGDKSAQPNASASTMTRAPIKLPRDKAEQREIAHILGTLDDKIELNRRMNATLEAIARAIFKSWFVDFDPVHAKARGEQPYGMDAETAALFPDAFEDSELGPIPAGWRVTTLSKTVEVVKGRSYKSSEIEQSNVALVTLKSINRGGGYNPQGLKPYTGKYRPEQIVSPGEIVVAFTDITQQAEVIGKPALVRGHPDYDSLIASLDLGIVRPMIVGMNIPYLYELLSTDGFQAHVLSYVNGSTVLHLNNRGIPSYRYPLPTPAVLAKFEALAQPLFDRISANEAESRTLAELRDTLLPKLISGEIRVSEAEALSGDRML